MHDLSSAALEPSFGLLQVGDLACRNHQEHLPQVVPVLQSGKAAGFRSPHEAVECREGNVLAVGAAVWSRPQMPPRQSNHPSEIAGPQTVNRFRAVARLESLGPESHAAEFRHGGDPWRVQKEYTTAGNSREA